jgi:hypothetical protein
MPKKKRRNRPPPSLRGPGPRERAIRGLPHPGSEPTRKGAVFQQAESPKEFAADASLAASIRRNRGLPIELAVKAYQVADRLLDNPDLDSHGVSKLANGIAQLAKIDIETGRYQVGENTEAQVNVQVNGAQQTMLEYAREVRNRIEAAYPKPPIMIDGVMVEQNGHS